MWSTFFTLFFTGTVLQFLSVAGIVTNPIRVVGIGPGLNITGYGIIERPRVGTTFGEAGMIVLAPDRGKNPPLRLG